jgi:hypothetical protein
LKEGGGYNYFLGNENMVTGRIKQLSFRDRIFIEQMDYQYKLPVSKQYHTKRPFIELLCLDSVRALNRYNNAGELFFLSEKPIRGMRIIVFEEFYHDALKQRFPYDHLNIENLAAYNNQNYTNPALQLIFSQIKRSITAGVSAELYYESKIAEILFIISSKDTCLIAPPQEGKHRLTLIFDYKPDGTFDYEMAGVPAEQGGAGTGGYLITGNRMATFLSFEGIAEYTFTVADNNTINVTEIEDGKPGNTAPFTRVSATPEAGPWHCPILSLEDGTPIYQAPKQPYILTTRPTGHLIMKWTAYPPSREG